MGELLHRRPPAAGAGRGFRGAQLLIGVPDALAPSPPVHEGCVDPEVPDIEVGHPGEGRHGVPVGGRDDSWKACGRGVGVTCLLRGNEETGRQTQHIPLEGSGSRLVEVVDIEDE